MNIAKHLKLLVIPLTATLMLSGCWLDDDDNNNDTVEPMPSNANIRVLHASVDAPTVDILANGVALSSKQNIDYQQASAWLSVAEGTYDLAVEANLPGDDQNVLELNAALMGEQTYTVLAVGAVADGTLDTLVVQNAVSEIGSGLVRAQVVHAAPDAPMVDVYVTTPDADLMNESALVTLSYLDMSGQVDIPAAEYRIRIALAGSNTVVFDSGTLSLAGGADLFIAATPSTVPGDSPVSLVIADGQGSTVLLDNDTPAEIRVVHAVADAPAVDIIANNQLTLVDNAAFKAATAYIEVAADDYLIDIAADADNSVVVIDDANVSLLAGMRYTAIANNNLDNIDLDLIVDMPRPLATAAQVRIFHASQAAPNVDIYVTPDGEIENVMPAFTNVAYETGTLAETGYVQLAAGDYVVTVTPTGTKTEAIETGVLALEAQGIYTAFAVDGDMEGDGPQLILLDDLAMPMNMLQ